MKQQNRSKGRMAEELAVRALLEKGYEILERNFQNRFGEIDIIAKDEETLVFVEVKAKTGVEMGMPEEMVNGRKLQRVRNMALLYMGETQGPCRVDVVAIVLNEDGQMIRLTHYENVE